MGYNSEQTTVNMTVTYFLQLAKCLAGEEQQRLALA